MSTLSEEQIELAVQTYVAAFGPANSMKGVAEEQRKAMRAAAPFLQLPWDEPSPQEIMATPTMKSLSWLDGNPQATPQHFLDATQEFVRHRNAVLLPKPVDPRLKFVESVLAKRYTAEDALLPSVAADILAALDSMPTPDFQFGFTGFKSMKEPHIETGYRDFIPPHPDPPREEFKKNEADIPQPVDPRRQRILMILRSFFKHGYPADAETLADRINESLDEVK